MRQSAKYDRTHNSMGQEVQPLLPGLKVEQRTDVEVCEAEGCEVVTPPDEEGCVFRYCPAHIHLAIIWKAK